MYVAYVAIVEENSWGGEVRALGDWEERNMVLPGSGRRDIGVYETLEEAEEALGEYLDEAAEAEYQESLREED